ncbi:UTRA domain-containing protein [Paraburkholderia sp. BL6669N2]|uniref:UTRA domain-containing protein n=1 Tax=Paraburkholderia sp. BL6669N2 TaxID=1938807 RepID=UPI002163E097|nr:UTRA domain-containing protein [Paraburkholderia sp. BL6669N2]
MGHADLSIRSMLASDVVAMALGVESSSASLGIERLVYGRDGAPVLFEALSYRGDAFRPVEGGAYSAVGERRFSS